MKFIRRKTIKRRHSTKRVMRHRRSSGRKRRFGRRAVGGLRSFSRGRAKFGNFLKRGVVGDTASALGSAVLVGALTDRIAPQYTPYAQLAAEYASGGLTGMVAAEGLKSIVGMPSILTGLLGGIGFGGGSQGPTGGAL